jgi:hypothetical protein
MPPDFTIRIRVVLVTLTLAGCHKSTPVHRSVEEAAPVVYGPCSPCPPDAPARSLIVAGVERAPSISFTPYYGVLIHADGLVEYLGRASVRVTGYCTSKLSPTRLDEVRRAVRQNPPRGLDEGTDPSDASMTRVLQGKPDGGYDDAATGEDERTSIPPLPLVSLARTLDELTGDSRWVGMVREHETGVPIDGLSGCPRPLSAAWTHWFPLMAVPEGASQPRNDSAH